MALDLKEGAVLAQCKYVLRLLERQGKLAWRRIQTGGIPRGDFKKGRGWFSKNKDQEGMTDLLVFLRGGVTLHPELKRTKGGRLSDSQRDWRDKLVALGHHWREIRSVDALIEWLEEFDAELNPWKVRKVG